MASTIWPVHPQPQSDELLSSWMIRIAWANGFKVHSFYSRFFGSDRQIWTRDIDHHAPAWLIEGMAAHTGVPTSRIEAMTLRAFESLVFEKFNETGATRFLMPLGVFHRTRRAYGQQFCSKCLREDMEPYLRRRWRLALIAACTRHGILLQDRCGACGHPLVPHRADMISRKGFPESTSMLRCGLCGVSVAGQETRVCPGDVDLQNQIHTVLDYGYALINSETPLYAHLYFDGLRLLVKCIPSEGVERRRWSVFEYASCSERLLALREAMKLLLDWPRHFLKKCVTIRQVYSRLSRDGDAIPYWLDSVSRRHLLNKPAPLSPTEARAIASAAKRITGSCGRPSMTRLSGRCVERYLPRHKKISDRTVRKLMASLDDEIRNSVSQLHRLLLQRDKAIFMLAHEHHLSMSAVTSLRIEAVRNYKRTEKGVRSAPTSSKIIKWYMKYVRPKLGTGYDRGVMFPSHSGRAMCRSTVGARCDRAVRAAGLRRAISGWAQWVR